MKTATDPASVAMRKRLEQLERELIQMQTDQIKFQRQQGLKEDIYRLRREITELEKNPINKKRKP